jgi:hypothetical protein
VGHKHLEDGIDLAGRQPVDIMNSERREIADCLDEGLASVPSSTDPPVGHTYSARLRRISCIGLPASGSRLNKRSASCGPARLHIHEEAV